MKHSRMQFLVAIAAVVAGMLGLQAKTVAWYHFNEGANGEIMAGGDGVYAVTNAVDPASLSGRAYQIKSSAFGLMDSGDSMPLWTNGTPSCVSWYDPVTGARGEDNRCMWVRSTNDTGARTASIVLVDDNAELHCANLTAECMVKMPEGKSLANGWSSIVVMRNGSTASDLAWGIRAQTDGRLMVHMTDVNNSANNFNGGTLGSERGGSGYFYTPTPSNGGPNIVDGKWHHLAITYDGSTVCAYVDYVLITSIAWSSGLVYGSNDNSKLCIGGFDAATYGNWPGCIDEVRISDEALPPEKFLRVSEVAGFAASDADTAIYLPFNTIETTKDPFFFNSACSTNADLINVSLSAYTSGAYPRLDTGVASVVSNVLHAGIFATSAIDNTGCWTYTNNLANPGKARYIIIDDFSKNNNKHLISSGDFTAEFFLKVPTTPTKTLRVMVENSGVKGAGTIYLTISTSYLYCTLYSQEEFEKYETTDGYKMTATDFYTSVGNIVGGDWHHVALVVDRTNQRAAFYLDGKPLRVVENFVLASDASNYTYSDYRYLKIGDGYSGNSANAFENISIDEFRITRRALMPQEFLIPGNVLSGSTRTWFRFEDDLSAEPVEGAIPDGVSNASTVSMTYSTDVPGVRGGRLLDGNGNVIRESNAKSMCFSGAHGSGESSADTSSQRLFFSRNLLLERDMKSMTVEFFMKGTKNEAKAWSTILRMYGNATGSDNSPFRRLWSIGYSDAAGHVYVIKDINGVAQTTFYPDNNVSFADGRWHHIAITFVPDGNGKTLCNFYKDYQQIGSQHTFNGEMECGDYGTSSVAIGSRYNGYIDEVRVSKGVLTVDQMMHVEKYGISIKIK